MTREEAKNWLNKLYVGADITDEYGDMVDMQPYSEAVDMAIKALDQKDVLNKIIEEIEIKLKEPQYQHVGEDWQVGLIIAEDIIDKYKDKTESEE